MYMYIHVFLILGPIIIFNIRPNINIRPHIINIRLYVHVRTCIFNIRHIILLEFVMY